jgi:hypothetical protein
MGGDLPAGKGLLSCVRPAPKEPNCASRHVVLISEWDTAYGRALPVAVANALIDAERDRTRPRTIAEPERTCPRPKTVADFQACDFRKCYPWLHYFSYMRGLDGIIPADKEQGGAKPAGAAPGAGKPAGTAGRPLLARATDAAERAEGQAQLDYLLRLGARIAELRDEKGTQARIFAIGVLGSDPHDKMLILQALRPSLQTTLFFTTDLDARLWHADNANWIRGLIVASRYGVRADEYDSAAAIAPFRGSYQTATFLAVRKAVPSAASGNTPHPSPEDAAGFDPAETGVTVNAVKPPFVRVFEIGRTGPVELVDSWALEQVPANRTEDRRNWRAWVLAAGFFIATLAGVLLLYHRGIGRGIRRHPLAALTWVAAGVAAIWGLWRHLASLGFDCTNPYAPAVCYEAFSSWSGISAWIPMYLLTLAFGLALLFIPMLLVVRCRTTRQIESFYLTVPERGPEPPSGPEPPPCLREGLARERRWLREHLRPRALVGSLGQGIRWLWETLSCRRSLVRFMLRDDGPDTVAAVWVRHCRRTRLGLRSLAPITLAIVFFFFVINLFILGGGGASSELRDPDLALIYTNLRVFSTLAVSLLVFLYLDIAGGARYLIAELNRPDLPWLTDVHQHYARDKLKVPVDLVDRWLALRVVARYADMGVRAVAYPLLVLLLLVAARMPWFDTNVLPVGILIAYVVLAFYLLVSAWLVQRAARRMRDATLGIYRKWLGELDQHKPWALGRRRKLRYLIERVESMHDFAFQRFSDNPLVRVAILPFGTLGLGLLEVLG